MLFLRMVRWCIRLTRLTLVCEVIRYRLVQVRQNLKRRLFGLAARNRLSLSLPLSFSSSSYFLSFSIQKWIFPVSHRLMVSTISVLGEPERVNLVWALKPDYLLLDIFLHLRLETWTQRTIDAARGEGASSAILFLRMVWRCIRLTHLILVCEVIRYRLVQVRPNLKRRLFGLAARNRLSLSLPLSFSSSSYFLSFSIQKKKIKAKALTDINPTNTSFTKTFPQILRAGIVYEVNLGHPSMPIIMYFRQEHMAFPWTIHITRRRWILNQSKHYWWRREGRRAQWTTTTDDKNTNKQTTTLTTRHIGVLAVCTLIAMGCVSVTTALESPPSVIGTGRATAARDWHASIRLGRFCERWKTPSTSSSPDDCPSSLPEPPRRSSVGVDIDRAASSTWDFHKASSSSRWWRSSDERAEAMAPLARTRASLDVLKLMPTSMMPSPSPPPSIWASPPSIWSSPPLLESIIANTSSSSSSGIAASPEWWACVSARFRWEAGEPPPLPGGALKMLVRLSSCRTNDFPKFKHHSSSSSRSSNSLHFFWGEPESKVSLLRRTRRWLPVACDVVERVRSASLKLLCSSIRGQKISLLCSALRSCSRTSPWPNCKKKHITSERR